MSIPETLGSVKGRDAKLTPGISLRAKGTLISEPRFSTPCEMRFFPRDTGKNRISQGVENRGSLISVPLALRVENMSYATPIRACFFPEIPAFTGFGARFLQPFPSFLVTVKCYSNTKWPLIAANGR